MHSAILESRSVTAREIMLMLQSKEAQFERHKEFLNTPVRRHGKGDTNSKKRSQGVLFQASKNYRLPAEFRGAALKGNNL